MNTLSENHYSTLEVDDGRLPEIAKPDGGNLPEAVVYSEKYPLENPLETPWTGKKPTRPATICGLRKRTFWIVLAVAIIVVIGAAVGGGVGASKASKSAAAAATTPTSTPTPTANSSLPTSTPTTLIANSKLASLNYTDVDNVVHYRIFYQVTTKAIYQSAWNSSVQSWVVSPVTTKDKIVNIANDLDVKSQTPIAANIYWHSALSIDVHIYFLNSQNILQELYAFSPDGPWNSGGSSGQYTAVDSSQIASYGRACAYCLDVNMIVYEGPSNTLQIIQLTGNGFTQSAIGSNLPTPVSGSALAIAPIIGNGSAGVALYTNSVNMNEIHYVDSSWTLRQKFSDVLSPSASIAAFSYGFNTTSDGLVTLQALTTNPDTASGGVSIISWNPNNNVWLGPNNPSILASVANYSSLAVNQAGRVYGIVSGSSGPGIVEWACDDSGTYTKVGSVTTPS